MSRVQPLDKPRRGCFAPRTPENRGVFCRRRPGSSSPSPPISARPDPGLLLLLVTLPVSLLWYTLVNELLQQRSTGRLECPAPGSSFTPRRAEGYAGPWKVNAARQFSRQSRRLAVERIPAGAGKAACQSAQRVRLRASDAPPSISPPRCDRHAYLSGSRLAAGWAARLNLVDKRRLYVWT